MNFPQPTLRGLLTPLTFLLLTVTTPVKAGIDPTHVPQCDPGYQPYACIFHVSLPFLIRTWVPIDAAGGVFSEEERNRDVPTVGRQCEKFRHRTPGRWRIPLCCNGVDDEFNGLVFGCYQEEATKHWWDGPGFDADAYPPKRYIREDDAVAVVEDEEEEGEVDGEEGEDGKRVWEY